MGNCSENWDADYAEDADKIGRYRLNFRGITPRWLGRRPATAARDYREGTLGKYPRRPRSVTPLKLGVLASRTTSKGAIHVRLQGSWLPPACVKALRSGCRGTTVQFAFWHRGFGRCPRLKALVQAYLSHIGMATLRVTDSPGREAHPPRQQRFARSCQVRYDDY